MSVKSDASSAFDMRLLQVYVALAPVLVMRISGGQALGIVDLLAPLGILLVFRRAPVAGQIQVLLFWIFAGSLLTSTVVLYMRGSFEVSDADLLRVIRLIAVFIPFLLVVQIVNFDRSTMLGLMRIFLWSGSAACLIGIGLYHFNIQMRDSQQLNWYDGESSLRAGGLLGNSSDFGHLAALLATTAIGYRLLKDSSRYFELIPFVIAGYAIYASSSRAAFLHLCIALAFTLPLLLRSRQAVGLFFAIPVGIALALIAWQSIKLTLISDRTFQRMDIFNISGDSGFFTSDARLSTWSQSWDYFSNSPVFGIGYNGILRETLRSGDNSFISMLTEGGIVSGCAYALFWLTTLFAIGRAVDKRIRYVGISLVAAEIAQMLTVDTHRLVTTTPIALALIASLLRIASTERARQRARSTVEGTTEPARRNPKHLGTRSSGRGRMPSAVAELHTRL